MSDLKVIAGLATTQLKLEREIADLEEQVKQAKDALRKVSESDLPDAMHAAGVEEFTMTDGRKVEIRKSYHASIPKARQDEAFSWLKEHGYDSIIKTVIRIEYGRGEERKAELHLRRFMAYKTLQDNTIVGDRSVNAATLKKFVREAMEDGEDLPLDAFGVFVRDVAVIGAVSK